MQQTAVDVLNLGGSMPSTDLSIWGLFFRADLIVKGVLVLLLFASFWSWSIIFEKIIRLRKLTRHTGAFEDAFWSGGSLEELYDRIEGKPQEPMAAMFSAAMREWRRSISKGINVKEARGGLQDRIERVMQVTLGREMDRLERYLAFLASVGSVAPFVGLFGTVWGIMDSFQSIALTRNTTLAVVAPGIAEALFATALGLVAAIPAVVAYNKINNDLVRYSSRLEAFAAEFSAILSRQLEERT
ncbi:MAG TPA: protein TolQ [Alphaproteobacteria bacterium]|nr:protein TolQ [Alphaproteobacteria bacterium]